MTATTKLHAIIENLTDAAEGEPVPRAAIRDACELLGMFPGARFRQAFHDAMRALEKAGIIERTPDDKISLLLYPEDVRPAKATGKAGDPYGEKPTATAADVDKLYAFIESAGGVENNPVNPFDFRDHMNVGVISCAAQDLVKQGRIRWASPPPTTSPHVVRVLPADKR